MNQKPTIVVSFGHLITNMGDEFNRVRYLCQNTQYRNIPKLLNRYSIKTMLLYAISNSKPSKI